MSSQTHAMGWILPFTAKAQEADWEVLYKEELPRIFNFFRYRVGDVSLAEDLTSTTFEKAWQHRDRYRRDLAGFSTWLFTIARNVAADHFRRHNVQVPLEAIHDVPSASNPEASAVKQAEFQRLSVLLATLPERERELLALKYGAGLTNRSIAQITGLSESNVGSLLHRTIHSLRESW
ncbi:MAG: sigma-70 family RNA polymerase sigma factor [Acidobacteria bacterium]|nr:sigma-70 family RNA polymerase sigma factor [Acidobacteriota bacterium]